MLIIPRNNMPSKKAEAEADGGGGAEASITLSFGGVDFCLCPDADSAFGPAASDGGALVSLVRQVAPGGPELALKNFSGTLRVAASCGGALQEPALATADAAADAAAAGGGSPSANANANANAARRVSPGDGGRPTAPSDDLEPASVLVGVIRDDGPDTPQAGNAKKGKGSGKTSGRKRAAEGRRQQQQQLQSMLKFTTKAADEKPAPPKRSRRLKGSSSQPLELDGKAEVCSPDQNQDQDQDQDQDQPMSLATLGQTQSVATVCADDEGSQLYQTMSTMPSQEEDTDHAPLPPASSSSSTDQPHPDSVSDANAGSSIMEIDAENDDSTEDGDKDEGEEPSSIAKVSEPAAPSIISQRGKHHPCARWGQSMTLVDHSRVLVYGGQTFDKDTDSLRTLSDIHVYDMATCKWSKPVNCDGVPRTWHTATFLPERQLLISFGGDQWDDKLGKVITTDEVMVLDTDIMLWYPPAVSGKIPSGRSGHTASLLPNTNELVVFGGVKNRKWQNSVALLDTTRWKWTVPKISGSAPRPRSYHSATAIGGSPGGRSRVVIFGGNDEGESFNSVHVLDASNSKMSWFNPVVSGSPPSPRSGHCATLLEDNKTILIYGGWDLNMEEEEGEGDDADMIFGDTYLLDTEIWTWSVGPNPKYVGMSGAPNGGTKRVGQSSVLAPSEEGAEVLCFGGRVPNDEFSSDFQRLVVKPSNVKLG